MLVHRGDRLVLLFTPPFDKTPLDPGYIKGYPPGIRENGGQYTHAAAWSIMGFAALGQGDKAHELFALLNPINHTATRAGVLRYKVEPYVVAADVYSVAPHVGRGGWTWYTGSAGWLYRAGVESILGLKVKGDRFEVAPCLPTTWPGFEMTLTLRGSVYEIVVRNPAGVSRGVVAVELDGVTQPVVDGKAVIRLGDEVARRTVVVTSGLRRYLRLAGVAGFTEEAMADAKVGATVLVFVLFGLLRLAVAAAMFHGHGRGGFLASRRRKSPHRRAMESTLRAFP